MKTASLVLVLGCLSALPVALLPAAIPPPPASSGFEAEKMGTTVLIRTSGGGEFRGILYSVQEDRVELLDSEGRIIAVSRSAIVYAETEDSSRLYFQDAAENRLIVMPTAFPMDEGEFQVANQEIAAFTASYGFGRHFTLWGGFSIPGALLNAKVSLPLSGFGSIAFGSFAGYAWLGKVWCGLPYLVVTRGTPERHLDAAAGLVAVFDPAADAAYYGIGALAGKVPLSGTTALIGESWCIVGREGAGSSGLQLSFIPMGAFRIASSRMSWDIGAAFPFGYRTGSGSFIGLGGGDFIPIPLVSFAYRVR